MCYAKYAVLRLASSRRQLIQRALAVAAVLGCGHLADASPTHAQSKIDQVLERGQTCYTQADFECAELALEETMQRSGLERRQLMKAYELRALVHYAVGDQESMTADFERWRLSVRTMSLGLTFRKSAAGISFDRPRSAPH